MEKVAEINYTCGPRHKVLLGKDSGDIFLIKIL